MDDIDRKIEEALNAEDRSLHAKFGEQGIWGQAFGVFDGKMRWLAVFATVLSFVFFIVFVICVWKFFTVTDPALAARWGVGALVMMTWTGFIKIWFWIRMESNRVLREVKRLELQIARMQGKQAS